MSDGIQLSSEMIEQVKSVIKKHDSQAESDLYFVQYLTAMSGFVLAHQKQSSAEKKLLVADLSQFMGQVVNQCEQDMKPPEDAFGIWKPESS